MSRTLLCLCLAAGLPLGAQYPGQYPPGQYPGRYPGGGLPIPWPRKGKTGQGKEGQDSKSQALNRATGTLRRIDEKTAVMEADDGRLLEYSLLAKTKFYKDTDKSAEIKAPDLKTGDRITVEATEDHDGYLYAVNVYREKAKPAAEQPSVGPSGTSRSEPPPRDSDDSGPPVLHRGQPAPRDRDDPGPPVLHRGKPANQPAEADEEDTTAPAPAAAPTVPERGPAAPAGDPVIVKARLATQNFAEKLPNYVCKEYMARYSSSTHPVDWRPQDVVSTEVVYQDGKEQYRNVAINGKATNKNIDQIGGAWSTGEFGTVLRDLFSPATAAEFHERRDDTIAGVPARIYDFKVDRPHSHWHISVASQSLTPSYRGSVWIELKTGRALRIEMQARDVPESFPLDTVESAVDYQYVRIGEGQFLLPVHAENLGCQRGSSYCSRNAIDFRNYHKYESESNITFSNEK